MSHHSAVCTFSVALGICAVVLALLLFYPATPERVQAATIVEERPVPEEAPNISEQIGTKATTVYFAGCGIF